MSDSTRDRPGGKRTLVEEGTVFKGDLTSSCPIVVMGKIEGEVVGPSIEIAETGQVSGRIKVSELRSRGELAGEIDAESVELSGRVHDRTIVRARSLDVSLRREGGLAVTFGDCELAIGDAPDKKAAVSEATGAGQQGRAAAEAMAVAAERAPEAEGRSAPAVPAAPPAEAAAAPIAESPAAIADAQPEPAPTAEAQPGAPAAEARTDEPPSGGGGRRGRRQQQGARPPTDEPTEKNPH